MTRSDDGERTCPLCAEEMDLTDQQLKPCRCGYEVCVWCWHHIMEMAEKDGLEGRCPACRTAYDKERIAGMAANCERLVNEVNTDKRAKGHKGKLKISAEARKQLADVRVIQRNLVYIVGMPLSVADVHILERKEYFGQYGKIMKVSVSRPGTGLQQSTISSAVGVYITYAREEEAVRCIQAVNNFVLEGKALRACFGTTKYCHSWIRNMTCTNPDCFYLHDICSQEDSFMKNEIISAYTRLPQFGSNNSRCRAGNILPPPADDVGSLNTTSSKHSTSHHKGSPPRGSGMIVRSMAFPTATTWGSRSSGSTSASLSCSESSRGQKQEVSYIKRDSSWEGGSVKVGKIPSKVREWLENGTDASMPRRDSICIGDSHDKLSNASLEVGLSSAWHDNTASTASRTTDDSSTAKFISSSRSSEAHEGGLVGKLSSTSLDPIVDDDARHISSAWDDDEDDMLAQESLVRNEMHAGARYRSPISSSSLIQDQEIQLSDDAFDDVTTEKIASTTCSSSSVGCIENAYVPDDRAWSSDNASHETFHPTSISVSSGASVRSGVHDSHPASDNLEDISSRLLQVELDERDIGSFEGNYFQKSNPVGSVGNSSNSVSIFEPPTSRPDHLDPAILSISSTLPEDAYVSGITSTAHSELEKQSPPLLDLGSSCLKIDVHDVNISSNPCSSNGIVNSLSGSLRDSDSTSSETLHMKMNIEFLSSNGHSDGKFGCLYNHENREDGSFHTASADSTDDGEKTIISNVLSMDFDPWSDPLSANNNFLKLLRDPGIQRAQVNSSGSLKPHSSSQSRFSFARHEEHSSSGMVPIKTRTFQDPFVDFPQHGPATSSLPQSVPILTGQSAVHIDRTAVVSRAKVSVPPGFSAAQNRASPPGFFYQNDANQIYGRGTPDSQISLGSSLGNLVSLPEHGNSSDVEFIDPAILAVVRGNSPVTVPKELSSGSFPPTPSISTDPRYQILMNQHIPHQQTHRISDQRVDNLLHLNGHLPPTWFNGQDFSNSLTMSRFLHPSQDAFLPNNMRDGTGGFQSGNHLFIAEALRKGLGSSSNLPGNENFNLHHMINPSSQFGQAFGL